MSLGVDGDLSERRAVTWIRTEYAVTVSKAQSAGIVGVFEAIVPAGEGPPIHVHHNEDEVIHVVEGSYEFWLNGSRFVRGPGASVFLPRGVPHTFRVIGDTPGRSIGVVTPGGFESFFSDAAETAPKIPDQMPALVELASRYGLEFVGAPPWA